MFATSASEPLVRVCQSSRCLLHTPRQRICVLSLYSDLTRDPQLQQQRQKTWDALIIGKNQSGQDASNPFEPISRTYSAAAFFSTDFDRARQAGRRAWLRMPFRRRRSRCSAPPPDSDVHATEALVAARQRRPSQISESLRLTSDAPPGTSESPLLAADLRSAKSQKRFGTPTLHELLKVRACSNYNPSLFRVKPLLVRTLQTIPSVRACFKLNFSERLLCMGIRVDALLSDVLRASCYRRLSAHNMHIAACTWQHALRS